MTACNAMAILQDAGLVLKLNPAGGLAVSPASQITPELRLVIKTNRDDLLAQLTQEFSIGTDLQPHNLDRWCWPRSEAMYRQEVDASSTRMIRFTDKGVNVAEAEQLADKLVLRDREGDDRRLCLECANLQGVGPWRCARFLVADVSSIGLAPELVVQLQRCPGFANAIAC